MVHTRWPRSLRGKTAPLWGTILFLWAWIAWPLVSGERTLFFRDVFSTHVHMKAFGAEELRQGRIPATNPRWALGQPFRGNPNAVAFYPSNALYLLLPFWSAFNLHFMLHWLIALIGMWRLARELEQEPSAALLAGATYAGSGWMLSALSFYNILIVSAWWPWVLWGMARGTRRGLALGGVACGLALLGGEPMTLAVGLIPLTAMAVWRHRLRGGPSRLVALGGIGALIAAPQIVATWRIFGFTFRGAHGLFPSEALDYALHPIRLLELILPLPFGNPAVLGPAGFWKNPLVPRIPYILTVYFGIVALALVFFALRRKKLWSGLAVAGLAAAWLGGVFAEPLRGLSGGLFRSPEKFLFIFALAVPLLAGWGLERAMEKRRARTLAFAGLGLLILGGLGRLVFARLVAAGKASLESAGTTSGEAIAGGVASVEAHAAGWVLGLAIGGTLLLLLAWTVLKGRREAAVLLQILALLPLAPLIMTTDTAPYRGEPTWERLPPGSLVVPATATDPPWEHPRFSIRGTQEDAVRAWVEAMASPAAILRGLGFPMALDLEGMHSPFFVLMGINLKPADWPVRLRWCRALGTDVLIASEPLDAFGLEEREKHNIHGQTFRLYELQGSAPLAWWPERTVLARSPVEAFARVSRAEDPVKSVAVTQEIPHQPGAFLRVAANRPDRIEIDVRGEGGVLAIRRAYQPIFKARSEAGALPTFPLNLVLTGIAVPAGEQRVVLEASAWPEAGAGVTALVALAGALWLSLIRSRTPSPHP